MKAVRFHEYGTPDVLRYEDVEQPVPAAGEVRIRVAATSFNPVDGNIRAGFMQGPIPVTLPHTPGIDVAGTVDALGEGADRVRAGDQVVGFLPMTGVEARRRSTCSHRASLLTAAPASIPLADAGGLPLVGLTAWQALFDHAKLTRRPAGADQRFGWRGRRLRRPAGQARWRTRDRHGRAAQQRTRQDGGCR